MNTKFAISRDGKQVAYDLSGAGPAVLLLHGGGGNRGEWHDAGYVRRLQAQGEDVLDIEALSLPDQEFLRTFNVPVMLAWGRAMLGWPAVEPGDFRCPVLWLVGSEDRPAMDNFKEYEASLAGSRVQAQIFEGLNHEQVFDEIERVFPTLLAFTRSN
jgi:pimeloyl-ACP methyl ester carboxylesterase